MSIELPGWVVDAFNLVGLPWPGIDEDQLRSWAGGLRAYAAEITALSGSSRSVVAALTASNDSSFARTLAAQWEHHHALISDLRGPMEGFAGALDIAADAVEAQKIVVIGAAVALAGEVIATQGEALVTFGLAEAEVPAEVAIARLAVKAALQELEGQLLGLLINKAAAEISGLVGGTIGKLISGGGQVAAEVVTLTADYHAMQTLSGALSGHAGMVEQASSVSWHKAGSGTLEEGGPGGGWREVAHAVEQAVLQVLKQLFVDLGRALWRIISDTISFLKKAIAALRHTDDTLAADASRAGRDAVGAGGAIGGGSGSGDDGIVAGSGYGDPRDGAGETSGLSAADRQAVWDYTTNDGYKTMNSYHRNPDNYTPEEAAAIQARSDRVSEALAKLPPRPGTTYRGVDLPDDVLKNYEEGSVVTEKAFTSTSTDPAIASGNFKGNTIAIITGKSGRDISEFSQYSYEKEILYDKGTQFIVTGKSWDPARNKWFIHMEEVGS